MNIKFNLGEVKLVAPKELGGNILLKDIEFEIADLDLKEYIEVLKTIPGIVREVRDAFAGDAGIQAAAAQLIGKILHEESDSTCGTCGSNGCKENENSHDPVLF